MKEITLEKFLTIFFVKFGSFLIIVSLAPLAGNQAVTGTIVNSILYLTTFTLGIYPAIFIAFIPSIISLGLGFLPATMMFMIPFIIISNIIMVVVFNYLKSKYWIKVMSASFLKFGFLFLTSYLLFNFFLSEKASSSMAIMMSWPQLFTAVSGGLIAYVLLKTVKKI